MNDQDHFLKRWSRRKAEQRLRADRKEVVPSAPVPPAQDSTAKPVTPSSGDAPAFDVTKLPSIDSITAATDIRGFLQPGVPSGLRNAALRRAWSVDPAIRDFRGLQENDWNFNDPSGIPGFGPLNPEADVGKMASALFGDVPQHEEQNGGTAVQAEKKHITTEGPAAESNKIAARECSPAYTKVVQRDENLAPQKKDESTPSRRPRRRGGALPQT